MICQILVYLLFHILSLDPVSGSQLEKISDDKEVEAIYSPFGPERREESTSSAVLSVDLKDVTKISVCFAFMVDGLVDVPTHPDTTTFWYMLAAMFPPDEVKIEIPFEDGSFRRKTSFQIIPNVLSFDTENFKTLEKLSFSTFLSVL